MSVDDADCRWRAGSSVLSGSQKASHRSLLVGSFGSRSRLLTPNELELGRNAAVSPWPARRQISEPHLNPIHLLPLTPMFAPPNPLPASMPPTLRGPWKAMVERLGRGVGQGNRGQLVRARCGGKHSTAGLQSIALTSSVLPNGHLLYNEFPFRFP